MSRIINVSNWSSSEVEGPVYASVLLDYFLDDKSNTWADKIIAFIESLDEAMSTPDEMNALIAEARRLENDYGDSYEVMCHMSDLADALEAVLPFLRPMPSREKIARVLDESDPEGGSRPDPGREAYEHWLPQADAVLALFEGVEG